MALSDLNNPLSLLDPTTLGLSTDDRGGTSLLMLVKGGSSLPQKVLLRGRAMPYRGTAWEVQQRVLTTWYPGNPVATQQVLGPQEEPTVFHGMWKARFMKPGTFEVDGDGFAVSTPAQAEDLFQRIARSGAQVTVVWLNLDRTGVLKRFKMEWDRETDAKWEMEFEWRSRLGEQERFGFPTSPIETAGDLLGAIDSFLDTVSEVANVATQMVAMAVADIAAVRDTASRVVDLVDQVSRLAEAPQALLGAVQSAISQLARQVLELVSRIAGSRMSSGTHRATARAGDNTAENAVGTNFQRQTSALIGGAREPDGIPFATMVAAAGPTTSAVSSNRGAVSSGAPASSAVSGSLAANAWRRAVARRLIDTYLTADRAAAAQIARREVRELRTITTRAGDTLYSVSNREFGEPDFANWLAQVNDLRDAIIPPGTQLRIPPRPVGSAQSIEFTRNGPDLGPDGTR